MYKYNLIGTYNKYRKFNLIYLNYLNYYILLVQY